jgi:hypothetical protein
MFRFSGIRLMLILALLAQLGPQLVTAQDDPDEIPLGDVARSLRKKTPPAKPVIDDDNLPQVMQEVDSHHEFGSGLRFLMSVNQGGFHVEAPDVTCSLSFTANVKSLLSGQYAEMELPPPELSKIEGKAVVEGDALTIPLFNGTQWHLSELTVAFTVIRKGRSGIGQIGHDVASVDPLVQELPGDAFEQVRPEKKADLTLIYRMRAAGLPWSNAVFSAPLNMELSPGEEWHWSIVQARGYPPETYVSSTKPSLTHHASQESVPSAVSLKSAEPQNADPIQPQPHQ